MADYKKLALGALAGVLAGGAVALVAEFAGEKPVFLGIFTEDKLLIFY